MGKGQMAVRDEYARLPGESQVAWMMRRARVKADKRDKTEPLVSIHTQRHGDYQDDTLYEVNDNGAVDRVLAKRNRGGTPICRWIAAGKLTDDQCLFIRKCQGLWWVAARTPRTTANYGERLGGGGDAELTATSVIEAREDLDRISGYFSGALKGYWDVFENVCRHDIAAGVAGAAGGYEGKAAQNRAHVIVCLVADYVNTREPV